jgi:hypothetical protein
LEEAKQEEESKTQEKPVEETGGKRKCKWSIPLLILLFAVLTLIVLAWRTEYLDQWLPGNIKEFFGRGSAGEEGGEEGEEAEEEGEGEEDLSLCGGADSKLESLDETWNVYYNCVLGFSIQVPKEMLHYHGSCEWDGSSYRPEDALVSTAVFEDNDSGIVYISSVLYFKLTGKTMAGGYTYFSGCEEVTNSLEHLNDEYLGEEGYYQQAWKILVETVNSDAELDAFIKERYGSGCGLGEKVAGSQDGVYDVEIDVPPAETMEEAEASGCLINYATVLKYYPAKNLAVSWDLGQAYTFYKVLGTGDETDIIYDEQMAESFLFLE